MLLPFNCVQSHVLIPRMALERRHGRATENGHHRLSGRLCQYGWHSVQFVFQERHSPEIHTRADRELRLPWHRNNRGSEYWDMAPSG